MTTPEYYTLFKAIAAALPGTWTLDTIQDVNAMATLTDGETTLIIHPASYPNQDKWYIAAHFQPHDNRVNTHGIERPSIKATRAKKPAMLAADIIRRLLPDARQACAEYKKRRESALDHVRRTNEATARLMAVAPAAITPITWGSDPGRLHISSLTVTPSVYGEINACGEHITLTLRSLTIDQAEAALKAIFTPAALAAADAEREAKRQELQAAYDSLTAEQKAALDEIRRERDANAHT